MVVLWIWGHIYEKHPLWSCNWATFHHWNNIIWQAKEHFLKRTSKKDPGSNLEITFITVLSLHLGTNWTFLSSGRIVSPVQSSEATGSVCRPEEVWLNQLLYSGGQACMRNQGPWMCLDQVRPLQGGQSSVSGWGRGGGGVGCCSSLQLSGDLEPR